MMKRLRTVVGRMVQTLVTVNLRAKIIGLAVGSVSLLGFAVSLNTSYVMSRNLDQELAFQSMSTARELAVQAATPMLTENVFALHQLLSTKLQEDVTVRYVFVVDTRGNVIDHTFNGGFPVGLASANSISHDRQSQLKIIPTDEGMIWDVAAPILGGTVGVVRVGLSDKQKQALLSSAVREHLLVVAGVAALGLAVAVLLGSIISSQAKVLARAARAVARGELGHQVKVWGRDDLGHLGKAFNSMSTALATMRNNLEQREAMTRQLLAKVISAQEEERRRVARELHDELGQSLSSLGYGLQSASLAVESDPAKAKSLLNQLHSENLRIQRELRATIYDLRPSVLDDLGLIPALRSYIDNRLVPAGIRVSFAMEGDALRLSAEVETALFRIAQEALNNIMRHASAQNVLVRATFRVDNSVIEIVDDGRGFDDSVWRTHPDGSGFGLLGMHERAELMGGHLEVTSKPGRGCRVVVLVPDYRTGNEQHG